MNRTTQQQLQQHWNRQIQNPWNIETIDQTVQHAIKRMQQRVRANRLHLVPVEGPGDRHTMLSLPYVHRHGKKGSCTVLSKVSFRFAVQDVCDVQRCWERLQQNHLGTDAKQYRFMCRLLLEGTPHCQEPHLKRQDRFRVVVFFFTNGISPFVLREWLWASGLLQTHDLEKTRKRWVHVEALFAQLEYHGIEGKLPSTFTAWDVRRQQKVYVLSGEKVVKKQHLN